MINHDLFNKYLQGLVDAERDLKYNPETRQIDGSPVFNGMNEGMTYPMRCSVRASHPAIAVLRKCASCANHCLFGNGSPLRIESNCSAGCYNAKHLVSSEYPHECEKYKANGYPVKDRNI